MPAFLRFVAGLAAAVAAHVVLLRLHPVLGAVVDPFLILVVYYALRRGLTGVGGNALPSALAGTVAGLVQDALTGGLFGLHGFANTLVAWTVAKVQQRMVIQQLLQIGLAGLLAQVFQLAILASLQFLMVPDAEMPPTLGVVLRMLAAGLLVAAVHAGAEKARAAEHDWREKRRSRLRFDT